MWNRTSIDFSQHVLTTKIFTEENGEKIRVDEFFKPGTITNWLKFINTKDILTVTWDFGNWVFCRPFIPSNNGEAISTPYWCEKLRNSSTQTAWEFDTETADKEIQEIIDNLEFELDEIRQKNEDDDNDIVVYEEIIDWWKELLTHTENEVEYLYYAYDYDWGRPNSIDSEEIPNWKKWHIWLEVVFDAFEEMCSRLPKEDNTK